MHISWRRRELVGERWPPIRDMRRNALEAMLGRSQRIEGKPTRIHIATLGSIDETALDHPAHRYVFWRTARSRVNELGLPAAETAAVMAKLEDKVKPIDESAFIDHVAWLELFLVDHKAAMAALFALGDAGVLDDGDLRTRSAFLTPVAEAESLRRRYVAALDLAQRKRLQAREAACQALGIDWHGVRHGLSNH